MSEDTTTIHVKLSPKASKNAVQGWSEDENGQKILKCSVTAMPEKGKANAALIKLLAKHFDIPKSAITVLKGTTSKNKTLEIQNIKFKTLAIQYFERISMH